MPSLLRLARLWLAVPAIACVAAGGCRDDTAVVAPRSDYAGVAGILEPFIRHEMAAKGLPGVSLALVDRGDIIWAAGFGLADPADSTPATAETLYRVGSIAKIVTAIGVMQLVERGEVELDAPVSRYLPDFRPANPSGEPLTVRQLLSHHSGLVREPPLGSYFDSSRVTLSAAVASLNGTTLVFPPGSRVKYSDAGMAVAGAIIEKQRGQPFAAAVQGSVLDPMGLTHTTFAPDLSLDLGLARGWRWSYDGRSAEAPRFELGVAPAAGLYSTATDLARLMGVLLDQGRGRRGPLRPETVARMWEAESRQADSIVGRDFGLGFRVATRDGVRRIGQSAAFDGYSTDLMLIPAETLGAVVITNKDAANAVTRRIADAALSLMRAAKRGEPLLPPAQTEPLPPELARRLEGSYVPRSAGAARGPVRLSASNGRLFLRRAGAEHRLEVRSLGDTLITDDLLGFGERILARGNAIVLAGDTLYRAGERKPAPVRDNWQPLIGEYGPDFNIVYIREEGGTLHAQVHSFYDYPLAEEAPDVFRFPDRGLYQGERVRFERNLDGRVTAAIVGGVPLPRRAIAPEDGSTFKIVPQRPTEELLREALDATPPAESGKLSPDLVELAKLDPAIKLDIRYATTNNFVNTAFYRQGRAFLQRPAANAVARASRKLRALGYGILIHDAYRPWYVTKMFWDATPPAQRIFVANPASGSRHNRGCAVDLTLYDLKTGRPVEMVSGYDEFSDRAYADYPGGTSLQRWHRRLLRQAMEAEGFTVYDAEWWHFDYQDWRKYPILNVRFEDLGAPPAR